jgi:hypothetical protein
MTQFAGGKTPTCKSQHEVGGGGVEESKQVEEEL